MTAFSYRLLQEEVGNLISSMKLQASVLANNIAAPTANFLLVRNYTEIEQILIRSIDFPGVVAIQICDSRGKLIGDVRRSHDKLSKVYYGEPPLQVPSETIASTQFSGNKMVAWQPIVLGELLGWTKITYSLQDIADAERRFWLTNAFVGLSIILLAIVALMALMRRPLNALERYTEFAGKLNELHGKEILVDHHSIELQQLGDALNNASKRLDEQGKAINNAMSELEQLAAFPEDSPDIVLSMDADAKITYMNPHGQLMLAELGFGSDKIEILLPKDYRAIVKRCLSYGTTARAVEIEYQQRTLLWTFAPLQRQEIIHCYAHEITEKKIAEEYARDAFVKKQSAEMANQAKGSFLANMSHEIRTPLNGVMGFLKLLSKTTLTTIQRDYLNTIEVSAKMLLTIINDILDFSKIEADKISMEKIEIELKELLEEVISLHAANAEEKGLNLILVVSRFVPTRLLGDPARISQVLSNLIGNAIKFTQHGDILVQVNLIEETDKDVQIEISVKDSGIGISEEAQQRLFQPFNQADASTTRKHGGTGLGLVISKTLAELMGGKIEITSQVGQGTRFAFTLRLPKQTTPWANSPLGEIKADLRILTVTPHALITLSLAESLFTCGITTDSRLSGESALQALKATSYAAIIFDQAIDDMTPYVFLEQVRALAPAPETPIILLGSMATCLQIEKIQSAGFSSCISKPVKSSELYKELGKIFIGAKKIVAAPEPQTPQLQSGQTGEKLHVLIVDDNDINRKLAKILVDQLGGESDLAENGAAAVEACKLRTYDLILMDVHMPVMDGAEATACIRESEKGNIHRTHIIALTADALSGDRECYLATGMDEYLSKPINENEFINVLHKLGLLANHANDGSINHAHDTTEINQETLLPIIDPQAGIQLAFGSEKIWRTALNMLLDTLPEYSEKMIAATNDLTCIGETAHKLAGASSYCGTPALYEQAKQVERLAKTGTMASNPQALHALLQQIDLLLALNQDGNFPDCKTPIYASTCH